MGLFSQNNDDDIDDIYDKLDDIYNRLEALDAVNAFSSRLSRLEKSSAYLENVLLENLKQLEKRTDSLETLCKTYEERITNLQTALEEVSKQQAQTMEQQQRLQELRQETTAQPSENNTSHDIAFEMECIKDDIQALKASINENHTETPSDEFAEKLKSAQSTADEAMIKALHMERLWQVGKVNERDMYDDLNALDDKIENLNKIVVDDSKNIRSLAKCIVNHSKYIQDLKDDLSKLGIKGEA